ncbi:indole acetimide hydrolase [Amycolatopsis sp. MJM2582]|uniref:amidase n=1 Tax=Amycolatopsis sp. MJM2582 TaxID=1427749 RepID=UPI00050680C4|nr:amidase [Amycolatopsis sp. MJM2582]KFZ81729.1 indole acetimide hydrolase [Amycolatopsis sp. MJM2582]
MNLRRPWSLRELVQDLRQGRTTPEAASQRALARIAETDAELRAWVDRTDFLPGAGVPLGVKDIIDLAGVPTRCGSTLRAEAVPATADAAIVTAWRAAGMAPLGKTVTTEFAFFAPGPTRNPAALGHTPGGSSSGSAAAVASGQVPLALGSQTAGSVTRPASYCGVASLVMSHGRYPVTGVTGLSPSLDSHGVFAATAADLALAWSALTGDPAREPRPPRILVWSADALDVVEAPMRHALTQAAKRLQDAGATVEPFREEQLMVELTAAHPVVMAYEAARERAAELAVAERLSAPLARLLQIGAATSADEYETARATIADGAVRLADAFDVVLGPAAPGAAPPGLDATGNPVLSRGWQALGLPVVTIPGFTDPAGLPLGLQLVGRHGGDDELLGHACWAERVLAGDSW